jgi:hypothetical protein
MFLFAKGENFMKIGWCPKCFYLQKEKNLWKLGFKYWQSSFIAQNFALNYSSSGEATQTQGGTSSTTSSGVKVVSHPLQGQCTSLRNIFNFVLHYIIPKLPALLLCFPSLMGGGTTCTEENTSCFPSFTETFMDFVIRVQMGSRKKLPGLGVQG